MPLQSTAVMRPATGLDRGGRVLLIRAAFLTLGGGDEATLAGVLFRTHYADPADYIDAVSAARGDSAAAAIHHALSEADMRARYPEDLAPPTKRSIRQAKALALLLAIPASDLLVEVLEPALCAGSNSVSPAIASRVNAILRARGAPYVLEDGRFEWVGEPEVEKSAIRPALKALADPRLCGGPAVEFGQARAELLTDTPSTRKQAVVEACNAVESTMKVLCTDRGVARNGNEGAAALFALLREASVLPSESDNLVLAASRAGNRRGRHGAGETAHSVDPCLAQATVAASAVAISFLAGHLG